jgi:hypothetical protein
MNTKIITVATKDDIGLKKLKDSLGEEKLEVVGLGSKWRGFGTKIIYLIKYLKTLQGYTHFIFVDAYDVIFLEQLYEIENRYHNSFAGKILFSTEKNCWPDPSLAEDYPDNPSRWKYLNSGAYIAPIKEFLELTDKYPIEYADDDQLYFTKLFLKEDIKLDYDCQIFQSYSFVADDEFKTFRGRLINNITHTLPAIIHGNGKTDMSYIYNVLDDRIYNSVDYMASIWQPTIQYNQQANNAFIKKVNDRPYLKKHRDFVEQNAWGFGERSFLWMWDLIIKEMPQKFTFLEIGVFRGAILSLIRIISERQNKVARRYGVTPLSPAEIGWESDYEADIKRIHKQFDIAEDYTIIKGDSTDLEVIKQAKGLELDILYIDGCHTTQCVRSDIVHYCPLLKVGGYLVIDDSANMFPMPFGYFTGIQTVCDGVDALLPPGTDNIDYQHLFNIVHNRVWKKIK